MTEPYSKPQNDLPPPLPSEPEEYNVPTVHSDPPGMAQQPPALVPPTLQPTPAAQRVTFTPPVSNQEPVPPVPPDPPFNPPMSPPANPPPSPTRTRKRGLRSLYWPGFVAGFMLLAGMSCGGAAVATGITNINLTGLQESSSGWSPPAVTATPMVQEQTPAEGVTDSGGLYQAGDVVRNITSSNVNIRALPGYLGKPGGDVLAQVLPGEALQILGSRSVADNLTWWQIRYQPAGGGVVEGWVAEATASGVQILGR